MRRRVWVTISSHAHGTLTEETVCYRGRLTEGYSDPRPHQVSFLAGSARATIPNTARSRADECYQPRTCCYAYIDHRPETHTSNRASVGAVGGTHVPAPLAAAAMSATVTPTDQACNERDFCYGVQCQQVPLDASGAALWGQHLLVCEERIQWDEAELTSEKWVTCICSQAAPACSRMTGS